MKSNVPATPFLQGEVAPPTPDSTSNDPQDQALPPWSINDIPAEFLDPEEVRDGGSSAEALEGSITSTISTVRPSTTPILDQSNPEANPPTTPGEVEVELPARKGPRLVKGRGAEPPPAPTPDRVWHSKLLKNSQFRILSNLTNAVRALELAPEWQGVLGYNSFAERVAVLKPTPWGKDGGLWTDQDDRMTTVWLQENGVLVGVDNAAEAVATVGRKHCFNPVLKYLGGLEWDGVERLGKWLETYLGVESTEYTDTVGKLWMISGVARAYKPGCKVDHALILEGKQGSRKSTALRELMPTPDLFADDLPDIGPKDSQTYVHGPWLIEIAELAAMGKADTEKIKSFISRQVDRLRRSYGRHEDNLPRTCFFAGTTNKDTWNRDETGGRRFWPVKTTTINLEGIVRDRDQLWAEAVHRFKAGEKWWIDNEHILNLAEVEQAARFEADAWFDSIAQWIENPVADEACPWPLQSTREYITTADILSHCLHIYDMVRWTQGDQNRVTKCMKALGWEKGNKKLPGNKVIKAYIKKV